MPDRTADSRTDVVRVGGRYRLLDEVGRGGMATVYRAHDDVLDRDVAVKVLHGHLADDPAFLERFRREARSAAALSHPNVVAVHDWGESDAEAFLVLHLVEGVSLRDVLRSCDKLEVVDAAAVVLPAARGLAAAHDAGFVHRDVKPENVLLGRDGTVRITDFGLARAAATATATFGDGILVGSPHYIAPEAVRGEPLTAAADVYGLGILLYESLVGSPPHHGDSPYATALAHTTTAVPAPSAADPAVPGDLDEVVLRATAADPAGRYPDAGAFADALVAAVPEAVSAYPPALADTALVRPVEASEASGDTAVVESDATTRIAPRAARRRGGRRLAALIVLLMFLGVGAYLVWDGLIAPVTEIPGVEGLAEDDAVRSLRADGFAPVVGAERRFDLETPAGHVLSQQPTGTARRGEEVTLTLSAGPRQIEVPPVVGEEQDVAAERLDTAGLDPVVEHAHDEDVAEGVVISATPAPGEVVDEASAVTVTVSRGPRPIAVPPLVGEALDAAREVLDGLGLDLEVAERRHDDTPAGQVIGQRPATGDELTRGDTVAVVVSEGPEPIEVPSVRSENVDEATNTLQDLGFTVEVERRGGFSAFLNPGRVYDQDPAPGSTRLPGAVVRLYAYEG